MIVAGILLCLICGSVITSASIYGVEIDAGEEWWSRELFLKFYSPSGRNYFIDYRTGELSLERTESTEPLEVKENVKDVSLPYLSFVSLKLKIYDIYFEHEDLNYMPHIVEKNITYEYRSTFIRHSLHSFVGPNNQVYKMLYNDDNISIKSEEPAKHFDHIQIKTLGPFSKFEHTYSFSQNGDSATDLTISPVNMLAERSIPLAEIDASILKEQNLLLANFQTPSGKKYLITNDLNIARVQDQEGVNNHQNESYVSFIEPNGKEYCVYFREEGKDYFPYLAPVQNEYENPQNIFGPIARLLSFVGPNKKLYRIDHDGESVPIIDSSPTQSSNIQIVVLVANKYYKKYIKFIFSNEGKDLLDRVEELDSTPLAELPPLHIDEVEPTSKIAEASFVKFFSPSGKNYYLTPGETKAQYAVEKGSKKEAQAPYLSFVLEDGRECKIFVTPGEVPYTETSSFDGSNSTTSISLLSFVTPNKKLYKMRLQEENGIRISYVDTTAQPIDPLDEKQVDALTIVIASSLRQYYYLFTWNGDKLVEAFARPRHRVATNVLKSLIG